MCKEHYDFYSENPATLKVMDEVQVLEDGYASWTLKLKRVFHWFVHLCLDIPMPLYEHFPLEHVFLAELYSLKNGNSNDPDRVRKVISDFDFPENENIAAMKRLLSNSDVDSSEICSKSDSLLGKKDLPSMKSPFIAVMGFILLYVFFEWIAPEDLVVRGADFPKIYIEYCRFIPYAYALTLFAILGVMIPSQYNRLIHRTYNLTLFNTLGENVDFVNQVMYVKERKEKSSSYYATLCGNLIGLMVLIIFLLLGRGTVISWFAVLLSCIVVISILPLVFTFSEIVLYKPVYNSLKKKRVHIDLYNSDKRGGLKYYHCLLYLTFLYNEGVAVVGISLYKALMIPNGWIVVLILLLLPRFNYAGWAIIGWIRSIVDFYRVKNEEKNRLFAQEGSVDNMDKTILLDKIHPLGLIPLLFSIVLYVIVPYIISQLPKWYDLLKGVGLVKP